jgi:hypothetical protein
MSKLTVLGLDDLDASIELSSGLAGILGVAEGIDFATGHLVLDIGAVGIFESLNAEKFILQLVMSSLGLKLGAYRKARLQHRSELLHSSIINLISRRRYVFGSARTISM